eukprot:gene46237-30756_t
MRVWTPIEDEWYGPPLSTEVTLEVPAGNARVVLDAQRKTRLFEMGGLKTPASRVVPRALNMSLTLRNLDLTNCKAKPFTDSCTKANTEGIGGKR